MNRTWQRRRVVETKDEISFAFVDGTEGRIDYIPFAEVKYVKEMKEQISDDYDTKHELCILQIATAEDGHNSGNTPPFLF